MKKNNVFCFAKPTNEVSNFAKQNRLDFAKMNGLIPAIIQDNKTSEILMLGFMNKESFKRTIKEKKVTFYSRTRKKIWQKGEHSGNYLEVISISTDCDNDSLLIKAIPHGPTCHTGDYSCFRLEKN